MKTRKQNLNLRGKDGIQLKFDFQNGSLVPSTKKKCSWLKSLSREIAKELLKEAIKEIAKNVIKNLPYYLDLIKDMFRYGLN
jgi:hypothetical protein